MTGSSRALKNEWTDRSTDGRTIERAASQARNESGIQTGRKENPNIKPAAAVHRVMACEACLDDLFALSESPPPEDFETEFGDPLRLPRTYVSLRATDPVHWRADNRRVTIHQRSATLLRELAQRDTVKCILR
jgi:hypothetical protein